MTAFTCAILAVYAVAADASLGRYHFSRIQMGMTFEITLYAADEATANQGAEAVFLRIVELNSILSDYEPTSELSRLSDTAGSGRAIKVSEPLWTVLSRAQDLAQRSDGAFDITVGPMIKLWRRARRQKELPDRSRLTAARAAVGYRHLRLDPEHLTARLDLPHMRLDLGGIAAGYAVDQGLAILKARGITRAMINASGDIGVSEPPPGASGWKIGIAPLEKPDGPPSRYLLLANAAVTTSGDAFQHVEIGGRRYSHIVDPRTGLGLTQPMSVTVVARDCMTADSYATAVCVLGRDSGLKLIEQTPAAAALIVIKTKEGAQAVESLGLAAYSARH